MVLTVKEIESKISSTYCTQLSQKPVTYLGYLHRLKYSKHQHSAGKSELKHVKYLLLVRHNRGMDQELIMDFHIISLYIIWM